MRARLLFVIVATGCAVSAATACSSPDATLEGSASARKTTQASSVSIAMFDKGGSSLGSCSGTLVAKDLVLTAGHCAAGAARWTIAHGADATSEATHAATPWKAFGSDLSHPDHSDVALLVLDQPIALDSYPAIATSKLADGATALRFARKAASADVTASSEIAVTSMAKKGFRLNYAAEIEAGGFVDTGGAIIDPKTGKIHGVVSGVGKESGLLHIARVDNFAKWITKATTCVSTSSGLGTRTYPDNGGSSGSSGWPGSGDWGGYGGDGDKLDGGGPSSTDGGTGTPGSSSGSSGSSSGSSGSSGTSSGGTDTSGSDSKCPGVPSCDGSDCPGGSGGPGGPSGSSSGSSGSSGAPGGGDEVCPGPPSCPEPDSQACSGAACGGCGGVSGCVDATIDYGNCASCGTPAGTGSSPVVR